MQPSLLDSSIYISALRSEKTALALERLTAGAILWLSAVVLQELYAGARGIATSGGQI
jgi:predicted nucleic acid-binding protein